MDPLSHCSGCFDLISDLLMHRLLIRLLYAQEEDFKWEQMISLMRVNFETNFRKMNVRSPLDS